MSLLGPGTVSLLPFILVSVVCSKPARDVEMAVEVISELSHFHFLLCTNDLMKKNGRGSTVQIPKVRFALHLPSNPHVPDSPILAQWDNSDQLCFQRLLYL